MPKVLPSVMFLSWCAWAVAAQPPAGKPEMEVLPLGAVRPDGWLREQLELQAKGLTGHAEELYEDIGRSDWLTGAKTGGQFAWERGPYYAKGLVALAFVLGDKTLVEKARRWVDAILASQRENGDFGPRDRNWWANMIALWMLRDWSEATGDGRVVPFLEKYFSFQREAFKASPLVSDSKWAVARAGDELEVVLWLFRRTGKGEWLDFAKVISSQSADWAGFYRRGGHPGGRSEGTRSHIVNFMQGLKTPALQYLIDGDEAKRGAYDAAFAPNGWVMRQCGRPDRMINGSEPMSDLSASQGTELCAIAERILSCQSVIAATGNLNAADDLEVVAYNSLAGTLSDDGKGMRYYCVLNLPACQKGAMLYANNGDGSSVCPGPDAGFGCCRSNFHFAWPKFVQSMWMRKGAGIAAVAYGSCRLETVIGSRKVVIEERTDYPFEGKVSLKIVEGTGRFPIHVRMPGWCGLPDAGRFRTYEREWKPGDCVTLDFLLAVRTSTWEGNAIAVHRGALLYALRPENEECPIGERRSAGGVAFPTRELKPVSPWGYALVVGPNGVLGQSVVDGSGTASRMRVHAVRTDYGGWGHMRDVVTSRAVDPPYGPIPDEGGRVETIELVPFCLTQTRIAIFPTVVKKGKRAASANGGCL